MFKLPPDEKCTTPSRNPKRARVEGRVSRKSRSPLTLVTRHSPLDLDTSLRQNCRAGNDQSRLSVAARL